MKLWWLVFFLSLGVVNPAVTRNLIMPQYIKNIAYDVFDKAGFKSQCTNDLKRVVSDLFHRKLYAFKMIDAWGKLNSGLLDGNVYSIGNFDECIKIHEDNTNGPPIDGQYCTVIVSPIENSTIKPNLRDATELKNRMFINNTVNLEQIMQIAKFALSICIPKSCSVNNLQNMWDHVQKTYNITVKLKFLDILCSDEENVPDAFWFDKYIFAAFGAFITLILLATFYDIAVHQYQEEKKGGLLVAFSACHNLRKIFTYPTYDSESSTVACLNGMKVITTFWVILGHRYLVNIFSSNINAFYFLEWKENLENVIFHAAVLSVDTFWTTSGFLVSYGIAKYKFAKEQERHVPYVAYFLGRYLRLGPALIATIMFNLSVFKYLGDGPGWPLVVRNMAGSCQKTWWATVLFLTNTVSSSTQCVEQTWSLAVDSQLFFAAPMIIYPLYRKPLKTTLFCLVLIATSALYTFWITVHTGYGASHLEGSIPFHDYIYQSTFVRCPVYIIGLLFGYFVYKHHNVKMSKVLTLFLWAFSLGTMLFLIHVYSNLTGQVYRPLYSATFNALGRAAWALAICVIIFLCASGHGGLINGFLSLPIFSVLIKISYSMFLTHLQVQIFMAARKKHNSHFNNITTYHEFCGDAVFTIVVSIVWSILFEAPFINIAKLLLNKDMNSNRAITTTENTEILSKKTKKKQNNYGRVYSVSNDENTSEEKKVK